MTDYRLKAAPIEIKVKQGFMGLVIERARRAAADALWNLRRLVGSRVR